ncbi:MAG: phospholipase D-like domain-containing protein, partial [Tepidiformaceae bacterium]
MRVRAKNQGISVHAIAGPYVVLLGFDVSPARRRGLLGFALHRKDHTEGEAGWLEGFRTFAETDPDPPPGHLVSTEEHPIQAFNWGDYRAKPNHRYTYT